MGSSGAPILNLLNLKVQGVHKRKTNFEFNEGTFIKFSIERFNKKYLNSNNKLNNSKYFNNVNNSDKNYNINNKDFINSNSEKDANIIHKNLINSLIKIKILNEIKENQNKIINI